MYVSAVALNDYRSYHELVVAFPPGVVVLIGKNGRGKTNLVEALGYLSTFSSHRVSADKALVRHVAGGQVSPTAAVIRANVTVADRTRLLELEIVHGKANRARLNRGQVAPRELLGQLRTVTFAPEDLQLLRGDPAGRRRFIDDIAVQLKPSFAGVRRDLEKILRQRAAVLKQLGRSSRPDTGYAADSLAAWDQALAKVSAQIVAHRVAAVESLRPLMVEQYRQVSDNDKDAALSYWSKLCEQEQQFSDSLASTAGLPNMPLVKDGYFQDLTEGIESLIPRFLSVLEHKREQEIRRGVNLVGAQRDDLELTIQDLPVKGYASHGETWSIVLALRLAQLGLLIAEETTPVLILDDVFAELDDGRRQAVVQAIADVEQVIVTAAVGSEIPAALHATEFSVTWDPQSGSTVVPVVPVPVPSVKAEVHE